MRTLVYELASENGTINTTSHAEMMAFRQEHPKAKVTTLLIERDRYADDEIIERLEEIKRKRIAKVMRG